MRNLLVIISLVAIGATLLTGCGSGADPNYSTEVELTEEQQKQAEINMQGQQAPGTIDRDTGTVESPPPSGTSGPG